MKTGKNLPSDQYFLLPLHLFEQRTLFGGCFWKIYKHLTFASLLIWTKGAEMHTQNWRFNKNYLRKIFMPSTCLNREQKSQGILAKNLQKNKAPRFLKAQKTKDRIRKNIKL